MAPVVWGADGSLEEEWVCSGLREKKQWVKLGLSATGGLVCAKGAGVGVKRGPQ